MKKTVLLTLFIFLSSCTTNFNKLKGSYPNKPYQITSERNYEAVWSNIIDFFAQNGLSIKLIDKSSGLIVSEKTSFRGHCTFETKNGTPGSPDAWIVVAKPKAGQTIKPEEVTGEWNVRIKKGDSSNCIVNVNLTNIQAYTVAVSTIYPAVSKVNYPAKSTGVFEKMIADIVK